MSTKRTHKTALVAKSATSESAVGTKRSTINFPEPPLTDEEHELASHEVTEKFEAFLQCATKEELLRLRTIFFYRMAADENPKPTLASAIVRAMRGELIAAPVIEGFDGAELVRRVAEIHETGRETLLTCLDSIEHDGGCTTPAEDFINSILQLYEMKRFTPKRVLRYFEEFRENYDSTERDVLRFIENNPHKLKELSDALLAQDAGHTPEAA